MRRTQLRLRPLTVFRYSRLQPFPDQAKYPSIGHPMLDELHRPFVAQVIEEATDVGSEYKLFNPSLGKPFQIAVRIGVNFEEFTVGFGVMYNEYGLDYAFST